MSLIHRRKSTIFNNPESTLSQLKLNKILTDNKSKLLLLNQCIAKSKRDGPMKITLKQANNLEQLHKRVNRRMSLNNLLEGYDENGSIGIVEDDICINKEKIQIFRSGVHYRSLSRAKGTGIKQKDTKDLEEYFHFDDSLHENKLKKTSFESSIITRYRSTLSVRSKIK